MNTKLNEEIISELLKVKEDGNLYHRESQTLEFKESFNFAGLAEYLKDFAAFANNKGGYIIFGVKDRPNRELSGLRDRAFEQFDKLDPERISGYILDIFSSNIFWTHDVFTSRNLKFGAFYVYEAKTKPIICKKDEGKDQTLKNGEIYYRYGGRTQKIQFAELEDIITKRINQNNSSWMDLMSKIAKAGPSNAAILDTEKGSIEKEESQILVVDEELVKDIQWIKEGDFSEKKGERTLKLVGEVQPINRVEVVKKVIENKYKEYPLSATELAEEVKSRDQNIGKSRIWAIIKESDLKNNKLYSDYVFRNKKQESEYENNGIVPKGIPSIYKTAAIDFIMKVCRNEQQ